VGGAMLSTEWLKLVPVRRDEVLAGIEALTPAHRVEVACACSGGEHGSPPWLFGFSATVRDTGAVVGAADSRALRTPKGSIRRIRSVGTPRRWPRP